MKKQAKQLPVQSTLGKPDKFADQLAARQSKELVIAFCGPVGSNIKVVKQQVRMALESLYGYKVVDVKVSEQIEKYAHKTGFKIEKSKWEDNKGKRYSDLQDGGNALREYYDNDILGKLIVTRINIERGSIGKGRDKGAHHQKIAYLVDSLKHPKEVEILRAVYRNMFYLFGIFCSGDIRKENLIADDIPPTMAGEIKERDKQEDFEHGQQLNKTLQFADIFINNNSSQPEEAKVKVERFVQLLLGELFITPSKDEYAMYIAHSAALRSGCISRQIGAAILNNNDEIISTGHNDAPMYGGGLYSHNIKNRKRCIDFSKRECFNTKEINKIEKKIEKSLLDSGVSKQSGMHKRLARDLMKEANLDDITEYSRAVHAEMEALLACSRNGVSTKGGVLYCTTFPCHNCARHIVASGIEKVYFIEPYEKSKALDLHKDSIKLEPLPQDASKKVAFSHFEGVAPRQYINLFQRKVDGKVDGKGVVINSEEAVPTLPEYLDPYSIVEDKVVENVTKLGLIEL